MEGWISIHRKIKDHWLYQDKPFCKSFAWIDLLLSANHCDRKFNLGNQIIEVEKGTFITSEVKLAEKWGWSRKTVRKFLTLLEKDKMLVKKSTTKYTTITIKNWTLYQNWEQQSIQQSIQQRDNNGTTKEQQRHTNNNVNNINNEKKVNNEIIAVDREKESADNCFKIYEQNIGMLTAHISEQIGSYLDDGISDELLKVAILEAVEKNKRNWSYIKAILNRFVSDQICTVCDYESQKIEYKANKGKTRAQEMDDYLESLCTETEGTQ